ncbi:MAG: hypothetical protein HGB05_11105, partial [Chloroflexi bacterium]|nr:hypothetical protein [Chloroflexota bacterium]
ISKDINLRMKAKSLGILAEDYETGKVPRVEDLYTGARVLDGIPPSVISRLYEQPFAMEAAWLHVVGRIVEATGCGLDPMIWVNDAAWALTQGATPAIAIEVLAETNEEVARIHKALMV